MRYVMALDGGGTKLHCLIADENGKLAGAGRGGPTNPNYSSRMKIEEAIRSAVSGALASGDVDKSRIRLVNATLIIGERWPLDLIQELLHSKVEIQCPSEMPISLYGAIQEDYGGLVLSGTGSFAAVRSGAEWMNVGGWGDVLGDEGSGYYIGQKALMTCAQMVDGVIPSSLLLDRVMEIFEIKNLREMVDKLSRVPPGEKRTVIASICSIAGWCADRGDPAAADIFGKAAFHLARQLRTAAERCGNHRIPVTVSGGAWKATPLFFQAFSHSLKQELPLAELRRPLFEPVVGGVLLGLRDEGFPVRERIGELKRNFSDYAYDEKNFRT